MAFFNYVSKEIILKVVYYGPGLSGKTTNLQYLYSVLDPSRKGKFISLTTESDRTLFFDFLPVDLGKIRDFTVRFQLYTVPGQIRYNATRKLVLKGADAVVFVADSQREMMEQNIESLADMKENLLSNGLDPEDIPVVMQYNKRDLSGLMSVKELNDGLNKRNWEVVEAAAVDGTGVEETFRLVTRILLKDLALRHKAESLQAVKKETPVHMPGVNAVKTAEKAPVPGPDLRDLGKSISLIQETLSLIQREIIENGKRQSGIIRALEEIRNYIDPSGRKKGWFNIFPK